SSIVSGRCARSNGCPGRRRGRGARRELRPVQYTVAPASPSMQAIPRPAPRVAPATSATRPRRDPMAGCSIDSGAVQDPSSAEILTGGLEPLAEALARRGARRVLVVTTPRRRGVDALVRALRGVEVTVFDRARVHVPVEVVEEAGRALAAAKADTV